MQELPVLPLPQEKAHRDATFHMQRMLAQTGPTQDNKYSLRCGFQPSQGMHIHTWKMLETNPLPSQYRYWIQRSWSWDGKSYTYHISICNKHPDFPLPTGADYSP